ncbi:MAG: ATP-grasp domain-containing protein [Deferribacterota bacterium]|nr:ATP-grasp domain-containing protein [Deferribacterota bacterium]
MGRLTEDNIKALMREDGLPVGDFYTTDSPSGVDKLANKLNFPIVLKALVPIGKKGKAGAVKFANNLEEARSRAEDLFSMTVRNYPVNKIIIEEKINIAKEFYISFTYDKIKYLPLLIISPEGGVDIEESSEIYQYHIDPFLGLNPFEARSLWIKAGLKGNLIQKLGNITTKLYHFFTKYDDYLLELNPLALTANNDLRIVGTLMGVDDAAMFRHSNLSSIVQIGSEKYWRPLTEREKKSVEVNEADPYRGTARYTEMENGDIGFMCGGGGASLLLFDALVSAGGKPANYSEFGGNPTAEKLYGLCKIILSKPGVKGLLVAQNITNNTQVDLVAEGVVRAIKDLGINPKKFPIIVREAGVNEKVAREIFEKEGIEYYADEITLTEVAEKMVKKMNEVYRSGYNS